MSVVFSCKPRACLRWSFFKKGCTAPSVVSFYRSGSCYRQDTVGSWRNFPGDCRGKLFSAIGSWKGSCGELAGMAASSTHKDPRKRTKRKLTHKISTCRNGGFRKELTLKC